MAAIDDPSRAASPAMLSAMDDDALVGLIAAGSDDAFAVLDRRYRRRLVRFARGFLAGGGSEAEDAVQDAMVRAVRALRAGSRPEAVGPWLHRIARNCALDVTAARRRHPVVELTERTHPVAEDTEAAVQRRLGVRTLVADVGGLPDSQRSALVLRELEGRTYADIADELDTTVPAVKSLLVRARSGLRRAREQRAAAAAAWLPLPLLQRLAERLGTLWEPVTASATPKVACAAALVAGSIPVLAPQTGLTTHHDQPPVPRVTDAAVAKRPVPPSRAGTGIGTTAPSHLTPALALQQDCADGRIDGRYPHALLQRALSTTTSGSSGEYADCVQPLQAALLKRGAGVAATGSTTKKTRGALPSAPL